MLLRIMVGYHFFKEGTSKLQDNNWTAEYFLRGAKGPLAPLFHGMLDDETGEKRLSVELDEDDGKWKVSTGLTELLWNNFLDASTTHYDFNSQDLVTQLVSQRDELEKQITTARENKDRSVNTRELENKRAAHEESIIAIRQQVQQAELIYEKHLTELKEWLGQNKTELIAHYSTQDRLDGFERDGPERESVAVYVDSLRGQVDTIRSDRQKKLNGWYGDVEAIWNSFESSINQLATGPQLEKGAISLHRPFDQESSALKIINKVIPWFDTIVGVLLILGLFTRFASLSAGLFLFSVLLSQPAWIPGTKSTFYESVEMFALFAIFATCAGRYGGLDFFLSQPSKTDQPDPEVQS